MIITISPDGSTVELEVKGVKGPACLELTKEIENEIGDVIERKLTSDYHQKTTHTEHQSLRGR